MKSARAQRKTITITEIGEKKVQEFKVKLVVLSLKGTKTRAILLHMSTADGKKQNSEDCASVYFMKRRN